MPQAAPAIMGAVASWVSSAAFMAGAAAGTAAALGTAAAWATYVAGTLALTVGLSKVSSALMGRPKLGAGPQSRKLVIRDSTQPRTILHGQGRTGGVLTYVNTAGSKNEYIDFVIAIAGHEIEEIGDVWFDDVKIDKASINGGAAGGGAVTAGDFAGKAWVYKYLGTDTQTASALLVANYPSEWTNDHRGRGVAYVHIRLRRDQDVFPQGPPSNFSFGYKGAKVYDPRLDTTAGGSGAHRVADPSTWAWSDNPALCVADYIIGGTITNSATRVNRRGFGADPADVNWTKVISAANICDESVTIPGSTTQARYVCDAVLSMGEYPADNLEQLLTSMLGQVTPPGAKYNLYAGAYASPSLTLNESDLAGAVEYAAGATRGERYNAVTGTRWDSTTGQEAEFLPRTSSTYETEDGGSRLDRAIELPCTTDEYRAQRIAQIILRRSREQSTLVWRGNLGCLRVGVWETVSVTVAELGLSGKVFRCISREFKPGATGEAIVELTLREENSGTYTDPLVGDYGSLNPSTPGSTSDDYVDTSGDLSVVFDPEFTYADSGAPQYWDTAGTVSVASGTAVLTCDGVTSPQIRTKHLRTFPVQVTAPWTISFTVRYRVASTLTGGNKRAFVKVFASEEAFTGATECDSQTLDLSTATVGAWYTEQFTLDYAPDGSKDRVRVQLIVDKTDVTAGTVEFDYCYGYRLSLVVDPGATVEPVTGYLTNESVTLAADSAGTVGSYATAVGYFKVFKGTTDVTSSASFAEVLETSCAAAINTAANTPYAGQPAGYYRVTALTADTGAYTVSATYEGVTITKTFSLAKAKAGDTGTGPPGAPALSISLSKSAVALLAYANGGVVSYADAAGQATVRSGTTNVTGSCTFSSVASGCTGSVNGSGAYSVTNLPGNSGTLTVSATYSGTTVSADFTVTKTGVGYEIVGALPATNLFEGRMVYLTTDDKLYRYTGSAWTAAVPAVDISGTITSTQIADDSISTPKLQANAITAAKIAADQINANHLTAGAVTTDKIQAGAITAAKIASNTITAVQIQTGTITAAQMQAGTITAASGILGSLAVVEANIADLAVGTIKIGNSAVTESAVDINDLGGGTVATGASWTQVPGVSVPVANIPFSGARVRIDVMMAVEAYGTAEDFQIGIERDYSGTWAGPWVRTRTAGPMVYAWTFLDETPIAGTIRYYLRINANSPKNVGKWGQTVMVGTVLKK